MSSSLAHQLRNINAAHASPISKLSKNKKPSFLFDSSEASDYDLDTIYAVGINGLTELRQYDERFHSFESTLFSESMKNFDRNLKVRVCVSLLPVLPLPVPFLISIHRAASLKT